MTYQETIDYLFGALPMYQRVGNEAFKKGLDNIISLCEALGQPQTQFKTLHVAGTNGKGSTSHSIAAVLQAAGYKTGLYTSPHLKSFTERVRIDGQEIPQQEVVDFVQNNKALFEEIKPSFFEMTVALAFWYFAKNQVDIAIIEVGLGGRLDSTNIIRPELSVITNISFDHTEMLGNTLALIAAEKAGIIKPFVPVVLGEILPETEQVFREKTAQENAPLIAANAILTAEYKGQDEEYQIFDVYKEGLLYFENLAFQLKGSYQRKNLPTIIAALDQLQRRGFSFTEHDLREGLANVSTLTGLKGRWQKLTTKPTTICDTGHNESGLAEVFAQIATQKFENLYMVVGVVREKDLEKILPLFPKNAYYFFCQPSVPRGLPAHELAEKAMLFELQGEIIADPNEALAQARSRAGEGDFIFVGGSTFVVADLKEI